MTAIDPTSWGPSGGRGRLRVDTIGLFAYVYPADEGHDEARTSFDWLCGRESAPWRLFVNDYVLDELLTLLARKSHPETAITALGHIRGSEALALVRVPDEVFERALETFGDYDDQIISFTDHVVSAHAFARDATVYTFDRQDFAMLGNDIIPR